PARWLRVATVGGGAPRGHTAIERAALNGFLAADDNTTGATLATYAAKPEGTVGVHLAFVALLRRATPGDADVLERTLAVVGAGIDAPVIDAEVVAGAVLVGLAFAAEGHVELRRGVDLHGATGGAAERDRRRVVVVVVVPTARGPAFAD